MEEQNQQELTYFKMNMLQAEIEMQGMIAENACKIARGEKPFYNEKSFKS